MRKGWFVASVGVMALAWSAPQAAGPQATPAQKATTPLQAVTAPTRSAPSAAPGMSAAAGRAMLDRYCVTCHNARVKTAGLMLDTVDVARVPEDAELWEKVITKLSGGMMPPAGQQRPDAGTVKAF